MRPLHHRFPLAALLLATLLPATSGARSDDLGPDVDGGLVDLASEVPDLEQGIQPSSTPSRFACRFDGAGAQGGAPAASLVLPVGVALLLAGRRRRP